MISAIVCCRNAASANEIRERVAGTIGVEHELIVIQNDQNKYSLAAAFNNGAAKARFAILCFMHDDLFFITKDWGVKVSHLLETGYDMIGVAGSAYKSRCISGWTSGISSMDHYNVYHGKAVQEASHYISNSDGDLFSAVVLDGMWVCTRKEVWENVKYQEKLFKGFHFYDIDFSFRAFLAGYKLGVTKSIDILHVSEGSFKDTWLKEAFLFHSTYKEKLPACSEELDKTEIQKNEWTVFNFWQKRLGNENISAKNKRKIISQSLYIQPRKMLRWLYQRSFKTAKA